jgi:hypothetical protein
MPEGATLPEHPVRLVAVSAVAITARVRRPRASDPSEWSWDAEQPRIASFSGDGLRFTCRFRTRACVPLQEGRVWDASLTLLGEFASAEALKRAQGTFFAATSALFVLIPFARAYLMQLGAVAGVEAPPLPLVVRPPQVSGPASRT